MLRPKLRVGLIGTGFMGKAHALAYSAAPRLFDLGVEIELHTVADIDELSAHSIARSHGFSHVTRNWRHVTENTEIDIVSITAPNALHKEMALAAIATGKHVYCEKPLAPQTREAEELTRAAEAASIKTQVGFNYLCNPMFALARDMISAGELGEIYSYRGLHAEDYMANSESPYTFRHDPDGGGALADLGSHALATAEFFLGPITEVMGDCVTVISERPEKGHRRRAVLVDDIGRAFLRFANGASGSIEGNWIATGRKMQHDFEIHGSKGAIGFSQEHLNELHFYSAGDSVGQQGFRRIEASPDHPPYGRFCVAPGHQIGFNDLKTIEAAGFLTAIAKDEAEPFNFRAGMRIQNLVSHIQQSARARQWLTVEN
ncbi:MAG: Gfo/Idh/MocA family oxidoreductase [Rhodobacteraceae bacterium]|nr:Gfo/Idh/MocA family oxidoreductase [Paracoccaceae bacterium]MCY4328265.1 Gfo/Idh/MocA family oxidoreductase [Paracoccaceae bacterium]